MKRSVVLTLLAIFAFSCFAALFGCTAEAEQSFIDIGGARLETKITGQARRYCSKNALSCADYYLLKLAETGSEREAANALCNGLYEELLKIAESAYAPPTEPRVVFSPDNEQPFEYLEGIAGKRADISALCLDAAKAMDSGGAIELKFEDVPPTVSTDDLKTKTSLMSVFSTSYASSGEARRYNVELAASKLNGWKISAGGFLSFNAAVGARSEENGFKIAKVIENGEFKNGVGGGVCQVSSTIYNAWLLAGLAVKDRRSHTLPVSYLAQGLDATVSDYIDLVLENDSDSDVYVAARAQNGKLTFCIYGVKSEYEIRVETEKIADIEPPEPRRVGEGERLIASVEGKKGCVIGSYQSFYRDGVLCLKKKLPESYYAPKQGVNYYIRENAAD